METKSNYTQFFNRELSWLDFNFRVLEEGTDKNNPLLERIKFFAIASSNLDEFFMVRVAALKTQQEEGLERVDISGRNPEQQLREIRKKVIQFLEKQYSDYHKTMAELREKTGITIMQYNELNKKDKEFLKNYYNEVIFPILTPLGVDGLRPFPELIGGATYILIKIKGEKEGYYYTMLEIPKVISRLIALPSNSQKEFILLDEVIVENFKTLFAGYNVVEYGFFRIVRDGDMMIDGGDSDDLLQEIEKELVNRRWRTPVRVEYSSKMSIDMLDFLKRGLKVEDEDFYEIRGPIDFGFLWSVSSLKGFDSYRFKPLVPFYNNKFSGKNLFKTIKKKNLLLYHPYDSFEHVSEFIKTAAQDEKVLAIKQTLYRVSGDSPIINALKEASRKGKQVTVLVELKARFDEEKNIKWARELEEAGCNVIYGVKKLKTHVKALLVIRKEEDGIRRYIQLGTGNYNNTTAKLYTDFSYFTSDKEIGIDISSLFNRITGFTKVENWKKISPAPDRLRETLYRLIEREIENAKKGKKAKIIAKVNSLADKGMIEKLYKASRAGVQIILIIRGICCLQAGQKGFSENISVYSLVGRFLEHTRAFYFENNGEAEFYLSSADWMTRNLDRRIEIIFPVEDKESKDKLWEYFQNILKDNCKLRIQNINGEYVKVKNDKGAFNSQEYYIVK
jgi:polyphosphate kinase